IKDHCAGVDRTIVIYRGTNELHTAAYKHLGRGAPASQFELWPQHSAALGALLNDVLSLSTYVSIAVDDQLFYPPSNFEVAAETLLEHLGFVWSWRLGHSERHTEVCLPCPHGSHWLTTAYSPSADYGYLFHSDGALYPTAAYTGKLDMYLPDWRTGDYIP